MKFLKNCGHYPFNRSLYGHDHLHQGIQKGPGEVLELGISQISGGSRTSVGGYINEMEDPSSAQFDVSDHRSLEEVIHWLLELGHIPSFAQPVTGRVGLGTAL